MRKAIAWGLGLVAIIGIGALAQQDSEPELLGTWLGRVEHNSQQGSIVVRFGKDLDGALAASVSMPEIDAWDAFVQPVTTTETGVSIGRWELTRTNDGGLTAIMPAAIVPVHEIPVTLRLSDPIDPAPAAVIEAPQGAPTWQVDLGGAVLAGIEYADGTVYVATDDGRVVALDTSNGEQRWEVQTGGAVRARPTATDNRLLVHSDDGLLWALERSTGAVLWSSPVSEIPVSRLPPSAAGSRYNHYASAAVVDGERVFVGGFDGALYALDLATGEKRWAFAATDTIAGTPALADGSLYFGSFDGRVYAVDASDGAERWRHETGGAVVSTPLVADGLVLVGSRSYDLLALDAATGEELWKYYYWYSWVESSAVEGDGIAFIGSSDAQKLNAIDLERRSLKWAFDTGGSVWGQPALGDRAVFAGAVGVAQYIVDHRGGFFAVDRSTGEPIWQFQLDSDTPVNGFAASPAVASGHVFAASLAGGVFAFPADGGS